MVLTNSLVRRLEVDFRVTLGIRSRYPILVVGKNAITEQIIALPHSFFLIIVHDFPAEFYFVALFADAHFVLASAL